MTYRKSLLLLLLLLLQLGIACPLRAQEGRDIPLADSPSAGPENAPVTIVEFIDFT
ncbi:MAG: hypothetical protein M0017_03440 [Desulfobacteraceae bacterium]|nr:hypothetical protein [Desulfobacteraceae bacterium]